MRCALIAVVLAGCRFEAEDGERRAMGCPADEVCSDDTPLGLRFIGGKFADQWRNDEWHTMAVGGTQTVEIVHGLPFTALSSGAGLDVVPIPPPRVILRALVPGSEYLRIVRPGSDELYDRILVHTAPIETVTFRHDDLWPFDPALPDDPELGIAMTSGSAAWLVIQLYDQLGERLLDESLTATSLSPAFARVTPGGWDRIFVDAFAAGTATIRVTGGDGIPRDVPLRIVDQIDNVECAVMFEYEPTSCEETLQLGISTMRCFHAMSGDDVVVGASWAFAGSPGLAVYQHYEPLTHCVTVRGIQLGTVRMLATAGGRSRAFSFEVVPPTEPRR